MLRDRALATPIRQEGFAISVGALGLAKGIAGISLLRLNGIFRILADVPPVSLSMILSRLALLRSGLSLLPSQERRQKPGGKGRARQHDPGPEHV